MPSLRLDEPDHHPDDGARGVELAALLARPSRRTRRSGTRTRRPSRSGNSKSSLRSRYLEKWTIRSRSFLSGIVDWPTLRVKSMCWTTPSSAGLSSSSAASALLSPSPTLWCSSLRRCSQRASARHEERVRVEVGRVGALLRLRRGSGPRPSSLAMTRSRAASNWSEAPLQEQHPEDVLLELRGIHLAAQDVRRREQVAFQLGQGQFPHARRPSCGLTGSLGLAATVAPACRSGECEVCGIISFDLAPRIAYCR